MPPRQCRQERSELTKRPPHQEAPPGAHAVADAGARSMRERGRLGMQPRIVKSGGFLGGHHEADHSSSIRLSDKHALGLVGSPYGFWYNGGSIPPRPSAGQRGSVRPSFSPPQGRDVGPEAAGRVTHEQSERTLPATSGQDARKPLRVRWIVNQVHRARRPFLP